MNIFHFGFGRIFSLGLKLWIAGFLSFFLSFYSLRITSHYFFISIVHIENLLLILLLVWMSYLFFFLAALKIFLFILVFQQFYHDVYKYLFSLYLYWVGLIGILECIFLQFWTIRSHYLLKYCFFPIPTLLSFWDSNYIRFRLSHHIASVSYVFLFPFSFLGFILDILYWLVFMFTNPVFYTHLMISFQYLDHIYMYINI